MWDEKDYTARSVQLICGLLLFGLLALDGLYLTSRHVSRYGYSAGGAGGLGLGYLAVRCLWYAVTGKDNINRDDF